MSTSTVSKNNASQRIVAASASSSQYRPSSQHQSLNVHQPSSIQHSSNVHRSSSIHQPSPVRQSSSVHQSSSQTTNYFGPVRSSLGQNHPQTPSSSYSQQRASPYTTHSPRTNRRQGGTSRQEVNIHSAHFEDENTRPGHFITINQNILDVLVERCSILETEVRTLHCKTDQLLKIALKAVKNHEDFPVTKPKSKPNPVLWNDQNLLERPRTPLPTTYLCYLVRRMYTADEIKSKVPQLEPKDGDERLEKIKECLVQLYFSHDPSLVHNFMETKGHDSLYSQERTKRSRDNSKARLAAAENNNSPNIDLNGINIINNQDNFDNDHDIDTFDDI